MLILIRSVLLATVKPIAGLAWEARSSGRSPHTRAFRTALHTCMCRQTRLT